MVTRRAMTIDRFVSNACPIAQQQEPQGRNPTPSPPPLGCSWKRLRTVKQPLVGLRDTPLRTLPRVFGGITIREPHGDVRPTAQVGSHVVSSSRSKVGW